MCMEGNRDMILIDENKLTNGCIELIANCYGIEVVYVDDEQYRDEIEKIIKIFRVKGE